MDTFRRTFATTYVRVAGVVLLLVLIVAVFGGALAPDDPLGQGDAIFAHAGTSGHLLGTDYVGRDVLSRLLSGAGASVLSAAAMVGVGLLLGAIPGVLSAFAGRWAEFGLLRFTDAMMALPPIVFAIAIAGLFTNGQVGAIIAIGVLLAPRFFRIARAETLGFAHQQYVEAATLLGASRTWIVRRHIWRKVLPTIAVTTATSAGYAVLAAASLGFLGLGVQAPDPTWGGMLAANVEHLAEDSWAPIWPGLFIALTAWSLNALADGLRDGLAAESGLVRGAVDDPDALLAGVVPAADDPHARDLAADGAASGGPDGTGDRDHAADPAPGGDGRVPVGAGAHGRPGAGREGVRDVG
ncbi:ABC transporter permease [Patulibacter sp. NPDC049589]|uniref:ABC transporter permease n=1 Tax=Patulibacter sp. NPDC049589 TaxID=3154731 RepID=UPI00344367A0